MKNKNPIIILTIVVSATLTLSLVGLVTSHVKKPTWSSCPTIQQFDSLVINVDNISKDLQFLDNKKLKKLETKLSELQDEIAAFENACEN